ncbi:hypothetical protein KSC_105130 [Ktedonobacter sp. SOSP1-52]|uniref:hypothetical protein n=1 Tax=Ktedonobacter sp. SOSP1-52 TaxID=2778366 RepID=UPI001A2B0AE5|nr:hypothetical protein [Ktedonobacter sp. SOSP1-52]GHO71621.1 hypothetical protein KSC_105130 [Ktedonobacter sp. SOSP1-52]
MDSLAKGQVVILAPRDIEDLSRLDVLRIGVRGNQCSQDLLAFADQLAMPFHILVRPSVLPHHEN